MQTDDLLASRSMHLLGAYFIIKTAAFRIGESDNDILFYGFDVLTHPSDRPSSPWQKVSIGREANIANDLGHLHH